MESCINDASSTGFAPTGVRPNGQLLTPVAYQGSVGTVSELTAVSATFESLTFPSIPVPSSGVALFAVGFAGLGVARGPNQRAGNSLHHYVPG